MLDNVIDISQFPVDKVNQTFRANRRLGLGIMGYVSMLRTKSEKYFHLTLYLFITIFYRFADLLFNLKIGYNTIEGRETAQLAMKTVQEESHKMSRDLAKTRGVFPNWEKSIYGPKGKNVPMRNAALTNVAPTGM